MAKQIGYAVVGLGAIARTSVLPAFARASENSRLIAVVSGDRAKAQQVGQEFKAAVYHYDELRQCLQRDDVNAAYIALPNSMHCDFAVEAARAGVHVLTEAPMCIIADECRRMIRICQTNRVRLMVAYRLHFRPAVQKALALVKAGHLGTVKTFSSDFTYRVEEADSVRLQRRLGGGTVYHLGVECINAARAFLGSEPAQIMAMTSRTSVRAGGDVDEGAVALIRFSDDRFAHFHTSFGEEPTATLTVFGEEALLRLTNPYDLSTETGLEIVRRGERQEMTFSRDEPFAATLTYFSSCLLAGREPEPSAVEGLQDVRVIEAIYRSARDGRPVTLPRLGRLEPTPQAARPMSHPPFDQRQAG